MSDMSDKCPIKNVVSLRSDYGALHEAPFFVLLSKNQNAKNED
jgi:hypothetical protein